MTKPNDNSAERNAQESPLLRLPPELRNRIWTYVLSTQDDTTPDADGQDFKWNLEEIHLDHHRRLPPDLRRDCPAAIRSWLLPFQEPGSCASIVGNHFSGAARCDLADQSALLCPVYLARRHQRVPRTQICQSVVHSW